MPVDIDAQHMQHLLFNDTPMHIETPDIRTPPQKSGLKLSFEQKKNQVPIVVQPDQHNNAPSKPSTQVRERELDVAAPRLPVSASIDPQPVDPQRNRGEIFEKVMNLSPATPLWQGEAVHTLLIVPDADSSAANLAPGAIKRLMDAGVQVTVVANKSQETEFKLLFPSVDTRTPDTLSQSTLPAADAVSTYADIGQLAGRLNPKRESKPLYTVRHAVKLVASQLKENAYCEHPILVGVTWSNDKQLESLAALARMPNVQLVSLQSHENNDANIAMEAFNARHSRTPMLPIELSHDGLLAHGNYFKAMDYVVSYDPAAVLMAKAFGVPVSHVHNPEEVQQATSDIMQRDKEAYKPKHSSVIDR